MIREGQFYQAWDKLLVLIFIVMNREKRLFSTRVMFSRSTIIHFFTTKKAIRLSTLYLL